MKFLVLISILVLGIINASNTKVYYYTTDDCYSGVPSAHSITYVHDVCYRDAMLPITPINEVIYRDCLLGQLEQSEFVKCIGTGSSIRSGSFKIIDGNVRHSYTTDDCTGDSTTDILENDCDFNAYGFTHTEVFPRRIDSDDDDSESHLDVGAGPLAGIVIGSAIFGAIVIIVCVCCCAGLLIILLVSLAVLIILTVVIIFLVWRFGFRSGGLKGDSDSPGLFYILKDRIKKRKNDVEDAVEDAVDGTVEELKDTITDLATHTLSNATTTVTNATTAVEDATIKVI